MKKSIKHPAPPALNAKEKAELERCLTLHGRTHRLLTGSIKLGSFVVGQMPDGAERSLVAYGWVEKHKGEMLIAPMLLVDCGCRVYEVYNVMHMAAFVNLIRKEHYRWLYDKHRDFWEKTMKEHDGVMYCDYNKHLAG